LIGIQPGHSWPGFSLQNSSDYAVVAKKHLRRTIGVVAGDKLNRCSRDSFGASRIFL
jgi:hypothetical protein